MTKSAKDLKVVGLQKLQHVRNPNSKEIIGFLWFSLFSLTSLPQGYCGYGCETAKPVPRPIHGFFCDLCRCQIYSILENDENNRPGNLKGSSTFMSTSLDIPFLALATLAA